MRIYGSESGLKLGGCSNNDDDEDGKYVWNPNAAYNNIIRYIHLTTPHTHSPISVQQFQA